MGKASGEPKHETSANLKVFSPSDESTPADYALYQNEPNPFNAETWIPYQLPEEVDVKLSIYTILGKLVRVMDLGKKEKGYYPAKDKAVHWDRTDAQGKKVKPGFYFYLITAGDFAETGVMTVLNYD